jgi:hypothetical protein
MALANKGSTRPTPVKTPAPKLGRNSGGQSYGQASDTTPSSVPPGQAVTSELGQNLRSSVDDPVLADVQAGGVKSQDDNFQTRTVDATPYPPAHGMTGPKPSPKIGADLTDNASEPVRQPGGTLGKV